MPSHICGNAATHAICGNAAWKRRRCRKTRRNTRAAMPRVESAAVPQRSARRNRLFICLNKLVCFPVMFQSVLKHILKLFSPEFLWSPKSVSWVPALEHAKNKLFSPYFLWSHECESWVPALEHAKNRNCLNKKWMHEKRFGDSKNTRRKHEFGNTQSTKLNIKLKHRKVKFQQTKTQSQIST